MVLSVQFLPEFVRLANIPPARVDLGQVLDVLKVKVQAYVH